MRTAFLWLHVLSGVLWIAGAAAFAIAATSLTPETTEFHDFAFRAAPAINRLNIASAASVLLTGGVNLLILGLPKRFGFSTGFVALLSAKVVVFAMMAIGLAISVRSRALLEAAIAAGGAGSAEMQMNRLGAISGLVAAMGAAALLLGLWLMGES